MSVVQVSKRDVAAHVVSLLASLFFASVALALSPVQGPAKSGTPARAVVVVVFLFSYTLLFVTYKYTNKNVNEE